MQKHMFPAWCVDSVDDVFPILSRLPTFLSAEGLLLGNGMEWDGMGVPGCDIVRSNYKLVYNRHHQIRNLLKNSLILVDLLTKANF